MAQASAEPGTESGWREFGPLDLTPILDAALDEFRESGFHGARCVRSRAGSA
ncbi:hypothetical protein REH65_00775 [Saccharopolyspora sp. ID03-671]|uniref:hypothetical protein n=1 Tax=Saccharopolyspora sp. ID03-671 TaxID=3073066 RepID=UPI003252A727